MTLSKTLRTAALTAALIPFGAHASSAGDPTVLPGSTQVGQPAWGSDHWTQAMTQLGLFRVHRDDCASATEVFIEVFTDDNSVQFGFCIDKDEHSAGSVEWEDARQECLDDGKRLPEPAEFKFACQIGTGLSNTTDDWEWASNFAPHTYVSGTTILYSTVLAGGAGCKSFINGNAGTSTNVSQSLPFRCVR